MPSVACKTCGVGSYCDGPQTTCEVCAEKLRKRISELESVLDKVAFGFEDEPPVALDKLTVLRAMARSVLKRPQMPQKDPPKSGKE